MYRFESLRQMADLAVADGITMGEVVLRRETEIGGLSREEVRSRLARHLEVMKDAAERGLAGVKTASGLGGGDAQRVEQRRLSGKSLVGGLFTRAVARAMAVNEVNAAMGLISASPTAGACGVVPGTLIALAEEYDLTDEQLIDGLLTAGGVGLIMAGNASISGAEGGCMAETGSAAAMAAAAVVELMGGTPHEAIEAAGIALKNTMGLVCDPIAGLVEAPCIKRNSNGAATALVSAELALAGVTSLIPPDEVVMAAAEVGRAMPSALKETAQGGLAATPTGRMIKMKLYGELAEIK